ncbi:ATP synthase F1 subunit delta [Agrilactobacillus fermenti]|uniref:ATP synthase F1 subunit delta n=1 Tax=Agrilactobacillus fermenti TaxID=2586909 RepID=UPI003A5C46BA
MALDKYTVGRRYAKALFELSDEHGNLEATYQELLAIRQIFTENDDLGQILTDTRLNLLEKKPILDALKQHFSPQMQTFLQMVFDYKRMDDILFMVDYFEKMYDEKNKTVLATVTTTVPLTDDQQQRLSDRLKTRFDANSVEITNVVDTSIMGGVIVRTEDKVIDGSIKTRLQKMRALLLNK